MKRKIRVLSAVMAAVMAATVLSACGGKKEPSETDDKIQNVTIWTGETGSKPIYDKMIAEFNSTIGKENGVRIIYEAKENLSQAMTVALQSDQAPTLFQAGSVAEYCEQGWISPLDDLPGGPELIEKYKEYLLEDKQIYRGKTYSLPSAKTTYGLVYNKDMFKAAGLVDENGEAKPPKTLAEVREYAKILTNKEKKEYGIVFPMKWSGWFSTEVSNIVRACVGFNGYNPQTGKYDYSGYKPVLEMLMGIKEDGSYMPGAEGLDNDPARSRFANGNIGMKFAANWDITVFNDQFPAKCDWGVAPMPTISEDEQYYQKVDYNTGYKVSKSAVENGDPAKIMLVYKWFLDDDTIRAFYKEAVVDPIDFSIVEGLESSKKNFKEFAQIGNISMLDAVEPKKEISGEITLERNFIDKVWPGEMTIDEAIAKQNDVMNKGVERYKELNPDYNTDKFIIKDWDRRR